MNVTLIACTRAVGAVDADPVSIVEQAASVCYDSKPTKSYRITKSCMASGHMSVLEHISFTFRVEGVSRALLAQLSRHRHASMSVRSQRYCREDGFTFVDPFPNDTGDKGFTFRMSMLDQRGAYSQLLAAGAEPEDARMVLPNACCTELYITANARALIEMSRTRLCARAQREIRELFRVMKREVAKVSPLVAEAMRPGCEIDPLHPFCTEHKTCGRHPKLEDVYKPVEE